MAFRRTRNAVSARTCGFESHLLRWQFLINSYMFNFFKKAKKEPQNLEEVIAELKKLESTVAGLKSELEKIKAANRLHFQKIGFVRYNPFSGVGSDQSFSLALLDENDDGFIITSLFSREGNRVYAKTVEKGSPGYQLSDEEKEALKKAIEKND